MPAAGDYFHRLEIQRNFPSLDASRRKVDNWQLFAFRKARRPRPSASATVAIADANRSEITALVFFVRQDSVTLQIDSNYQLLYMRKTYKIESATDPDGRREEVEIACKAREFAK